MSNVFVIIKMCYVHNQWYDISCATLYKNGCMMEVRSDVRKWKELDLFHVRLLVSGLPGLNLTKSVLFIAHSKLKG